MSAPTRRDPAIDAILAELPLDDTGHVTACGYDANDSCACYTLPERLAAILDAVRLTA